MMAEYAAENVGRAACRKRHDEPHRAAGKVCDGASCEE
jgi:hypothetical protein